MFFTEVQDVSASVAARKGCVLELRVRVAQEQALCLSPPDERPTTSGRLAQLGERCVRNAEVGSSILLPSTNLRSPAFMRELRVASPAKGVHHSGAASVPAATVDCSRRHF